VFVITISDVYSCLQQLMIGCLAIHLIDVVLDELMKYYEKSEEGRRRLTNLLHFPQTLTFDNYRKLYLLTEEPIVIFSTTQIFLGGELLLLSKISHWVYTPPTSQLASLRQIKFISNTFAITIDVIQLPLETKFHAFISSTK
jgi:hypothetical protein